MLNLELLNVGNLIGFSEGKRVSTSIGKHSRKNFPNLIITTFPFTTLTTVIFSTLYTFTCLFIVQTTVNYHIHLKSVFESSEIHLNYCILSTWTAGEKIIVLEWNLWQFHIDSCCCVLWVIYHKVHSTSNPLCRSLTYDEWKVDDKWQIKCELVNWLWTRSLKLLPTTGRNDN